VAVGATEPTAAERLEMAKQGRTYDPNTKTWSASISETAKEVKENIADKAHKVGVAVGLSEPTLADKASEAKSSASNLASPRTQQQEMKHTAATGSTSFGQPTFTEKAKDTARDVKDAVSDTAHRAGVAVGVSTPTLADKARDAKDTARDAKNTATGNTWTDKAKETAHEVKESVENTAHRAGVAMGVASPTLSEKASDVKQSVSDTAHKVGVAVGVSEPTASDKLSDAKRDAKDAAYHGLDSMQRGGQQGEHDKKAAKEGVNRGVADLSDAANRAGRDAKGAVKDAAYNAADTVQRGAKQAKETISKQ